MNKMIFILLSFLSLIACEPQIEGSKQEETTSDTLEIKITGSVKEVMLRGELGSKIDLDTLEEREGLYGLGPLENLRGELMIYNGRSYVSRVGDYPFMKVNEEYNVSAPFFVYTNVTKWKQLELPEIFNTRHLELIIDSLNPEKDKPFVFRLEGVVKRARIHIQNLPLGTEVSSPKQAHSGQINYELRARPSKIIGFFSRRHKGIFTHIDSYVHMHLLSDDLEMMGHIEQLETRNIKLYIPE
ncbi:MAG: alpha-acetolactate decarboxylase [Flavobacteriales bacterium]|nr:alpha-acetolactate decarboxylase [Flavobacteriales bacterium]|tara:strand:+ start:700 stop:1425 length:726 start_codon:yes stop_codon:yes gene_type:complete